MASIKTIKIHPATGIARLGNSLTDFFVGPELPGAARRPNGGFRDAQGRIKRQAARFRLYGYDKRGRLIGEITARDATITWTAHLANKKAAWRMFEGLNPNAPWRNAGIADRGSLVIDPGPRSLTGTNQAAKFDSGQFMGTKVPLGEVRTDAKGRLLVLGGFGNSSSPSNAPITTFANNDGWHDDVADGPVTASVRLKGSTAPLQAQGAWVVVAAPKFAPRIDNPITLYDVLLQLAVSKFGWKLPAKPSFRRDIYPILQRAIHMKWVTAMAAASHKTFAAVIPPPGTAAARKAIFDRLKDPNGPGGGDMPMVWSDHYPKPETEPLTKVQYGVLKKWRDGNFVNDWARPPKPNRTVTPAGLDRAALETCVGGAFFPGIEASWFVRDTYAYVEPFRLSHAGLEPGDVTKQMAVPWQADFFDCQMEDPNAWWPAQRPDDVFPEAGGPQVPWTRNLAVSMADMVKTWHRLGFVVKKGNRYVETERRP
jgi:hypothetical protein